MAKQAGSRGNVKVTYVAQSSSQPRPIPRGSLSSMSEPHLSGAPPPVEIWPGTRLAMGWAVGFGMGFCMPAVVFRLVSRTARLMPAAYIRTRRHWELPDEGGRSILLTEPEMAARLARECTPLACEALAPCALLPFVHDCWDATVRRAVETLAEDFGEVLLPDDVAAIWAERLASEVHRE